MNNDWQTLRALADLVARGQSIPPALQERANAAIARAVGRGALPARPPGRPRKDRPSTKSIRAALLMTLFERRGMLKARAAERVGDLMHTENAYRLAAEGQAYAATLLDAANPEHYSLDLVADDHEITAVNEAQKLTE